MIVRLADLEADAAAIMDGARDFASRIAFRSLLPNDDAAFTEAVARIMALDGLEAIVAEHEGLVVAGIGVLFAPYLWNPAVTVGDELFWWAARDAPYGAGPKVAEEALRRIEERGAVPLFRALQTSPRGVGRFYRRIGLQPVEVSFMRIA